MRSRWIGETEFRLLCQLLDLQPDVSLLDVGCGTGWFTRRFAALPELRVAGIDTTPNGSPTRPGGRCPCPAIRRRELRPRGVRDHTVFHKGLAARLAGNRTRHPTRFAIGVLNRTSLLWRDKGRGGGTGVYHGAHWHTYTELRPTLAVLPMGNIRFRTAIFLPSGSCIARATEYVLPNALPWGGFLVVSGEVTRANITP